MTDLSKTVAPKSDQLTADDLLSGPRTITITDVRGVSGEQPIAIDYNGDNGKPFFPCKTIRRVLLGIWGQDGKSYIGRSLTLFRDPKVQFGGLEVGGIRVSHASHIEDRVLIPVQARKGAKSGYKVEPLQLERQVPDDPAFRFANAYIAKVERCATIDALAAYEADRAVKLVDLREKRPDQAERVDRAVKARYAALANDGALSPDNPAAREGRDDVDMGEGFGGEDGE